MIPARKSTAMTILVGPVLDADGAVFSGGVVADWKGSTNGAAPAALNGSATLTYRTAGQYSLALTATDLGTTGKFQVLLDDDPNAAQPVAIVVIEQAVYDALFATSAPGYVPNQPVDVNTIKTQSVTCAAGVTVSPFVGSTGAAINGTNANTLSSHDPGATLGTSTLTQAQVTGGAYALNSASFSFNAALDFTTTQKTSLGTAVAGNPVTLANAAHGGVAAVLTLERMIVASATTGEPAVKLTGNGAGAGLQSFGGATGPGGYFKAGATSGHGLYLETQNASYSALATIAAGSGNAIHAFGKFTIDDTMVVSNGITANITGNLSGSVNSVTTGVTVTTNNDKTGYSLTVTPPTASAIATAVLAAAASSPIEANIKQVNDVVVQGTGSSGDEWGPT